MLKFLKRILGLCKHDFWRKLLPFDGSYMNSAYTKFRWSDEQRTSDEWYCLKCGKVSLEDHTPSEHDQNMKILQALQTREVI